MSGLFYKLGKMAGPTVRKVNWIWQSMTATEADAIHAEHDLGQAMARQITNRLELDTEPRTARILNKTGHRLSACVANKLRTFSFEGIKGTEPNAFALPGGFIFVTSSLLKLCEWNEGEIAFILAHEMAHVIRGHAMTRIITDSAIAVGAGALSVRRLGAPWLAQAGTRFLKSAYSQDMELEADTLAVRLVTAAGCDTGAPAKLLTRLSELNRPAGRFSLANYFSSHPPFGIRIQNINRLLRKKL